MPDSSLDDRTPGASGLLVRGLTKRCPRCGAGKLFTRWVRMRADCPKCAYHFEREEGFFLGAFVMNVIVTEIAIIALITLGFVLTSPHTPLVPLAGLAVALGGLMPIVAYPFAKTTWTAVDMIMRKTMGESYRSGRQPGLDRSAAPAATAASGSTTH